MDFFANIEKLVPKIIFRFAVFSTAISFVGCSQQNQKEEKPVLKAYRLIDEQRTDEAIELLELEIEKAPENKEFKAVLASAYAHKAGIKIQKLVPTIIQADNLKKLKEKNQNVEKISNFGTKLNQITKNSASLLVKLSRFMEVYGSVPVLTGYQDSYIRHSISILKSLGSDISPTDVLYRAILQVILFKHELSSNLIGEFVEPLETEDECSIDISSLNENLISLGKLLIDIYNDLAYVNPKQAGDMQKLSRETANTISDLMITTTMLVVLDNASADFLKQIAVNHGFGKIIKCSGN